MGDGNRIVHLAVCKWGAISMNEANAILIIGLAWLYFTFEFDQMFLIAGIGFALGMWSYHALADERKARMVAEIRYLNAKANHFEKKWEGYR